MDDDPQEKAGTMDTRHPANQFLLVSQLCLGKIFGKRACILPEISTIR